MPFHLRSFGLSHVGLVRENNEDVWGELTSKNFYILSDGMGGHLAGDIAARFTVDELCKFVDARLPAQPSTLQEEQLDSVMAAFVEGIKQVNRYVYTKGLERTEWQGMGATLCCIYFCAQHAVYAHVGDSRIYRLRKGRLDQLTEDHSLVKQLLASGHINEEQAERFHYKNIITRAIGTHPEVEPAIDSIELQAQDLFLLCSDGLTDLMQRQQIKQILSASTDLAEKGNKLVQAACDAGGRDNITVLLIQVEEDVAENLSR
jgi:PPM family protein phosphatase